MARHIRHTALISKPGRSRGAALVMSLVILLVLTLLSVTSMNTSNLQLLMTGSTQHQTVALNTAEQVIREAELLVDAIVNGTQAPPADGYIIIPANDNGTDLTTFTWAENETITAADGSSRYIIEYSGSKSLPDTTFSYINGQPVSGGVVYVFRITARATASRGAVRMVQSIYVTLNQPA